MNPAIILLVLGTVISLVEMEPVKKDSVFVVRQVNTFEKDTLISNDHVKGKETASRVGRQRRSVVYLRQVTDGKVLLRLFHKDGVLVDCELEHDPEEIRQFQESFEADSRRDSSSPSLDGRLFEEVDEWLKMDKECTALLESDSDNKAKTRSRRSIIFPGTTWCGIGNVSKSNDLVEGAHGEIDMCCRSHDNCPYTIEGFSRKYNFFNFRFHTISHCECDERYVEHVLDVN